MVTMATMITMTTMIIPTTLTATTHTVTHHMRPGLTRARPGVDISPPGGTLWTFRMGGLR